MSKYHKIVNEISDLGVKNKQLTPEAKQHLQEQLNRYMEANNKEVFDSDCFGFLVTYVYNESYRGAITEVLDIIRKQR